MRIILPSPLRNALLLALAICYSDIAGAAAPAGQWWSAASSYRQKITVTTGASAPVNRYNGYSVARTFDTAALVTASKMQADCDDLRVLWWNGTGWVELDRDISGCNTASTQIWFKLQADIADSASDDNYYIYYGNASATAGPANKNNVYVYYDDFESNSLGAAPSGWSVIAGNATVESDAGDKALRMHSASANSRVNLIKNISPTEKDIFVEADCKIDTSVTTNGYCGVGSRFSGTNAANETGYMGDIRYNTDQSLSQRYVSGAWTGIGSLNEAVTRGVYYRVRLTTVGTTIKMYRDGTLKTNNTDAGISAANMLGIDAYNSATGVYEFLDNYLARRFVEPEPTAAAASEEKILSGTAYADEGVTNVGAGKTVRLIKNGADAGSTVTDASGAYSIAAVVNAGDALLVYIDNDVAYKGTTASVSNGASLASFDIYATHLVTRHDNAGTLTNALLSTAKGPYTDADILYSVAAGNLTVSGAGTELYVLTGHGFAPGGNVTTPALENRGSFDGGTGVINVNGDFTQAGGTFTATTGTLTITIGNWTMSGGTFNSNGGTVVFGDTGGGATITGSHTLANATFNINNFGSRVWTIAAGTTLTVAGTLTFDNSSIGGTVINTGTLAAQGNIVVADANSYTGTALLLINGVGTQSFTGSATQAAGSVPNVQINKPSGTLTLAGTLRTNNNWTYTAGTLDPGTSTVVFGDPPDGATITGSHSLNHVTFDSNSFGGRIWTIAAGTTLTVAGTLTFDNSNTGSMTINTGTLAAQGNIVVADANSYPGTALLLINGVGAQSFTGSATQAAGSVPNVQINKPSGTLTLAGTLRTNNNWTYTAGTLDPGTSTVVFGDPLGGSQTITGSHSLNHVTFDSNTGGGRTWVVAAGTTLTVAGTLTFDNSSTGSMTINTGTLAAQGNVTVLPPQTAGSAVLLFSGTANQLFNLTGATADFNLDIQVNKTGGRVDLASALTLDAANQDLTIQQGTFDLAGNNLTVSGSGSTFVVLNGGNLQLQGGETTTLPTLNAGSTVTYDGAGSYASLVAGNGYSNLTFNGAGSWTHTAPLTVNGNFTVTSGTLNSAGQNVTVTGNWSNSGTYTSGANTVTFNGANQSISGNTTFNHFTKSVISADTLTFAAGSATTINGTATLNGASGQLLSLRSSTPGTRWNFTLSSSATKAISYVDVRDSDASGSVAALLSINPPNSSDSGNNVAWFAITVTGTVYSDEGVTNIGAGKTVRLLRNGVSLGTAITDAAGAFGFNAAIATGDALLLYIDGNDGATTDATTVTVSPGGASSNLDVYVDHLITRHDNTGTLTNALLSTAKGAYADTEILSTVAAGNLTVSGTGTELFVPSGHSFAPGGNITTPNMESKGTFSGGTGTIDINGALVVSGGTFTATSGTTTIAGNFTISAGTFNHNSGTIISDAPVPRTIDVGAATVNHYLINIGTNTLTVTGSMAVAGNLTIQAVSTIGGTVAVAGNVTSTDSAMGGSGVILFNGSGAQTLSAGGSTGALPGVSINKSSGTLTIQDTIKIDGTGGWTWTAGTVDAGTSTVVFSNSSVGKSVNSGSMTFNNVTVDLGSSNPLTVTGTTNVAGTLTLTTYSGINTGTIAASGNVITTATSGGGTGTLLFNGTGAQTLSAAGGSGSVPNIVINKPSGTLTIQDTINLGGTSWTHTAGTVDATASTVVFTNTSASKSVNAAGMSFNNVTVNVNNSNNLTVTGTLDVDGNFAITSVNVINGGTITVAGSVSSADATVGGTAALTLDGTGAQTITATGADLPNGTLTINKASGTVTLASNLTLNSAGQDFTVSSGTLDLAGYNLVLTGAGDVLTVGAAGTLQLQGSETVAATTKTFNAGSTVIYNGGGTYASLVMGNAYHHLTFNGAGSWTHTGALDANGNLTITAGTLISGGQNVNVAGNWSNSGTYTSGANTVTLDGTGQTLTGNTSFNNLTKSVTAADTLTFAAGSTTSVAAGGKLTFTGAPGNLLRLRSGTPGTGWFLNVGAGVAPVANYVDVQDSNAGGGQTIYAYYSTDSLRNTNWVFGQQLQLVKQVWDLAGNCLASRPADAACNGGVDSVTVPAGIAVRFVIFVRNPMAVAASDLRLQDLIDDSGFTYQAGTLRRSAVDSTAPADTATLATLYAAATVVQTDARDGATQIDEFTGIDTTASPDQLTVGGSGGASDNDILNLPAYKTFVLAFRAVKN